MKRQLFTLSFGVGALILATQHAFAQNDRNCAPRDRVLERLSTTYGEVRQSIGLAPNNGVFEVFASPASGTWTITMTRPDGLTCLVASGLAYEDLTELPMPPGIKA